MSTDNYSVFDSSEVCEVLAKLLADSYFLYLKTHNYHWNVKGENFFSLHNLFEVQYNEMFQALDVIAERIRMIGYDVPGSFQEFRQLSTIEEEKLPHNPNMMVKKLKDDHYSMITSLKQYLANIAHTDDEGTKNLLVDRLVAHEKAHWMLQSSFNE